MNVRDIMTADVVVASPDDDLMRAAQLMESHDIGSLPIGDNGRLIGMLTDRDITIRGVARGLEFAFRQRAALDQPIRARQLAVGHRQRLLGRAHH